MLGDRRRLLVVRPEAPGPELEPGPGLMHELELPRKLALTTPGLGTRAASVTVARSPGATANCTPMRRRPRRRLQLSRPLGVRASLPFHVWPAYPYLSPGHYARKWYPAKFKKLRSDRSDWNRQRWLTPHSCSAYPLCSRKAISRTRSPLSSGRVAPRAGGARSQTARSERRCRAAHRRACDRSGSSAG